MVNGTKTRKKIKATRGLPWLFLQFEPRLQNVFHLTPHLDLWCPGAVGFERRAGGVSGGLRDAGDEGCVAA